MTYQEKLKAVMSRLDSAGADSEEEWAANILKAIGIVPEESGLPSVSPTTPQPKPTSPVRSDEAADEDFNSYRLCSLLFPKTPWTSSSGAED